jgi:hypothetical protein
LEFQYVAEQGDTFSWELLLHCGDALIQELLSRADDPQVFWDLYLYFTYSMLTMWNSSFINLSFSFVMESVDLLQKEYCALQITFYPPRGF